MSGNRFEFLEIGEKAAVPAVDDDKVDPAIAAPGREPIGPRDSFGRPLSEVRPGDLHEPGHSLALEQQAKPALLTPASYSAPSQLRVAEVIGTRGAAVGQFNFPTGVAVDSGGVLYVADSYNHRIQRITPNGGVAIIGNRGAGHGQFLSPQGVATDARSAFFIVEQGNNRVQKYSVQGILQLCFGRPGRGAGELRNPTGIAVAPGSGDIYVADTGNARVQRFDCEGNFLATLGAVGGIYPALVSPQALSVDAYDNLYVADTFAHCIVRYDSLGRHIGRVNCGPLREPRALASDPRGMLYVADTAPGSDINSEGRLQALEPATGTSRASVVKMNGTGTLQRPGGVAVSHIADGGASAQQSFSDVYVADTLNHRILRFAWN